jgi:hypothetical protein
MQYPEIFNVEDDGVGGAGVMARTRAVGALGARSIIDRRNNGQGQGENCVIRTYYYRYYTYSTAVTITNRPKRGGCSWQEANGKRQTADLTQGRRELGQGRAGHLGALSSQAWRASLAPGSAGTSCPPTDSFPFLGKLRLPLSAQHTSTRPCPGGAPRASGHTEVGSLALPTPHLPTPLHAVGSGTSGKEVPSVCNTSITPRDVP